MRVPVCGPCDGRPSGRDCFPRRAAAGGIPEGRPEPCGLRGGGAPDARLFHVLFPALKASAGGRFFESSELCRRFSRFPAAHAARLREKRRCGGACRRSARARMHPQKAGFRRQEAPGGAALGICPEKTAPGTAARKSRRKRAPAFLRRMSRQAVLPPPILCSRTPGTAAGARRGQRRPELRFNARRRVGNARTRAASRCPRLPVRFVSSAPV